jgi:hypothetical protein
MTALFVSFMYAVRRSNQSGDNDDLFHTLLYAQKRIISGYELLKRSYQVMSSTNAHTFIQSRSNSAYAYAYAYAYDHDDYYDYAYDCDSLRLCLCS